MPIQTGKEKHTDPQNQQNKQTTTGDKKQQTETHYGAEEKKNMKWIE